MARAAVLGASPRWKFRALGLFALLAFLVPKFAFGGEVNTRSPLYGKIYEYMQLSHVVGACQSLGYPIDQQSIEAAAGAFQTDLDASDLDADAISAMIDDASRKSFAIFMSANQMPNTEGRSEIEIARDVKDYFRRMRSLCDEYRASPKWAKFFPSISKADLDKTILEKEDDALRLTGYASWQTALTRAQADLVSAAGACQLQIGLVRHDEIVAAYLAGPEPQDFDGKRLRALLTEWHNKGLQMAADVDLNKAQCDRLIAGRQADLAKAMAAPSP